MPHKIKFYISNEVAKELRRGKNGILVTTTSTPCVGNDFCVVPESDLVAALGEVERLRAENEQLAAQLADALSELESLKEKGCASYAQRIGLAGGNF